MGTPARHCYCQLWTRLWPPAPTTRLWKLSSISSAIHQHTQEIRQIRKSKRHLKHWVDITFWSVIGQPTILEAILTWEARWNPSQMLMRLNLQPWSQLESSICRSCILWATHWALILLEAQRDNWKWLKQPTLFHAWQHWIQLDFSSILRAFCWAITWAWLPLMVRKNFILWWNFKAFFNYALLH